MEDSYLLCRGGDEIDNAVFNAIQTLNHSELEWDMSLIGEVSDFIERLLSSRGLEPCHPWQDDDENICYSTPERCAYCHRRQYLTGPKNIYEE